MPSVRIFDGVDATGNLLVALDLTAIGTGQCGDPEGLLCFWTPITVSFSGTAKSIAFEGPRALIGVDNISFSSDTAVVSVPEPSTYAIMALGLAGLAAWPRRPQCRIIHDPASPCRRRLKENPCLLTVSFIERA